MIKVCSQSGLPLRLFPSSCLDKAKDITRHPVACLKARATDSIRVNDRPSLYLFRL